MLTVIGKLKPFKDSDLKNLTDLKGISQIFYLSAISYLDGKLKMESEKFGKSADRVSIEKCLHNVRNFYFMVPTFFLSVKKGAKV